jgi:hypothetical protein
MINTEEELQERCGDKPIISLTSSDWERISCDLQLSENIIRMFWNNVSWYHISIHQILSESFMNEFKHLINWYNVSIYQKLSEEFMIANEKTLNWYNMSAHQKLSREMMSRFAIRIDYELTKYNWRMWKTWEMDDLKREMISKHYEIINVEGTEYVICYKAVHNDYSSIYNRYMYTYDDISKTYETNCDFHSENENSFGFSCWTYENAVAFAVERRIEEYRIIKVMCPLEYTCMTRIDKIIRSEQMKIIDL